LDSSTSINRLGPVLSLLAETERQFADRMAKSRLSAWAYEFLRFGMKQAWACLFGGIMVALMIGTHY
jgi:hypothetical protein